MEDSSVWIVEDNALFRDAVGDMIDGTPGMCCALRAGTGEDALAAMDKGAVPDVVLMDIGLPGLDGIEATRRIRSLSPTTRVIMLTVHATDEKVFAAICAGASGYLLKAGGADRVVGAIREVQGGSAPINGAIARRVLNMFASIAPSELPAEGHGLTARESQILERLTAGLNKQQIADELRISFHTVDAHVRNVYDKLHVRSRAAAVAKAVREGLV